MLIFCSEETLFSAEIGMDDRMEAPSLKYVAGLVGEGFVDFQYQQTVFFQVLLGDVRDGAVEAKWVVVGNDELFRDVYSQLIVNIITNTIVFVLIALFYSIAYRKE